MTSTPRVQRAILLAALLAVCAGPAHAYVGPGLGAGAIGALVGVVGAVLLAVFAVVYYPIKRMLRRRSAPHAAVPAKTEEAKPGR
mgnify:CR=1 FL=1